MHHVEDSGVKKLRVSWAYHENHPEDARNREFIALGREVISRHMVILTIFIVRSATRTGGQEARSKKFKIQTRSPYIHSTALCRNLRSLPGCGGRDRDPLKTFFLFKYSDGSTFRDLS